DWLHELRRTDRVSSILVGQAITALLAEEPGLGRPLVDRIKGLQAAQPQRAAPRLIRGNRDTDLVHLRSSPERRTASYRDKAGQWDRWYGQAIPLAEVRYETS